MFGDRKYCERNDAGLGFKNVEVLEHEKKADQFTIRIRYTASANVPLPDFAKKFVPAEMSITQRDSWDLKKRTGQLEVEVRRSEEHTSELQSLMRISYAVFCLKKNNIHIIKRQYNNINRKNTIKTEQTRTSNLIKQ